MIRIKSSRSEYHRSIITSIVFNFFRYSKSVRSNANFKNQIFLSVLLIFKIFFFFFNSGVYRKDDRYLTKITITDPILLVWSSSSLNVHPKPFMDLWGRWGGGREMKNSNLLNSHEYRKYLLDPGMQKHSVNGT